VVDSELLKQSDGGGFHLSAWDDRKKQVEEAAETEKTTKQGHPEG